MEKLHLVPPPGDPETADAVYQVLKFKGEIGDGKEKTVYWNILNYPLTAGLGAVIYNIEDGPPPSESISDITDWDNHGEG